MDKEWLPEEPDFMSFKANIRNIEYRRKCRYSSRGLMLALNQWDKDDEMLKEILKTNDIIQEDN